MNIRWTRTGQIKGSKVMEAVAWSKEMTAWVAKKHSVTVDTWLDTAGTINTIRWTVDYPDLASFDKVMTAVMMDPEYWKYVERAMKSELFIDGAGFDTLSKKM